jgi:predicted ATPase with chaperone activity
MALSPAARAALEQFKTQRSGGALVEEPQDAIDDGGNYENDDHTQLPTIEQPVIHSVQDIKATNAVNLDRLTASNNGLFRPEQPKTLKEAGISYRVVESLILKTIKQEGALNENQIAEHLRVAMTVFREVLISLHKRELLDTPIPLHYDLTNKGRELTALLEREDAYVGPAPVSFKDYCQMCEQQARRERRCSLGDVDDVFSNYPMRPELKLLLKEGFNSQRVMLFYGPPGNGKSLITDNLHRLLRDPVVLPYSFEFNSKVVQLYDPAYHKLRNDLMSKEEESRASSLSTSDKPDRRWLISAPPLVTVGTEFKVSHFEIAFDGQYSAPPHVKANNGIFIFDDLGRQTEDHNMILNQFIYPLEQRESIIKFSGGSSMRAPFLQRLFLSTNLNHEELLDDAFKRRLLYQILVDRPTNDLWKDILRREALRNGCTEKTAIELGETLVRWYQEDERVIRACDPRNIFTMIDATLDEGQRAGDVLDMTMFRRIYDKYPAAYKHEAKFYVGAMDAVGAEETAAVKLSDTNREAYSSTRKVSNNDNVS